LVGALAELAVIRRVNRHLLSELGIKLTHVSVTRLEQTQPLNYDDERKIPDKETKKNRQKNQTTCRAIKIQLNSSKLGGREVKTPTL